MSFLWAHQLLWELLHQPSVYLSIYFCLQNVRLFAWGTRAPQSAFCAQRQSWAKELTAQPGYKQGERGEHSTSDAELRYGAEREQHLQEDNCFTEIKLLQKTQLYTDIQPLPCCGLCIHVPISTQSQTERKLCIYIEISARFCLFAVGAAGERWNIWANSAIADALC